jgi:hypothetical protein
MPSLTEHLLLCVQGEDQGVRLALDYHGVNPNRPTSDVHNPGGIIIRIIEVLR